MSRSLFLSKIYGMKDFIFDLDGTLLDTIEGIRAAINEALRQCGYDYGFDKEETKTLIGDGADALVHRALKEEDTPEHFQTLKKAYMPLYRSEQESHTFLFPHLKETLTELKKKGARLFVCTNKPDSFAVRIVNKLYGEGFFEEIRGQREGEAPKPDPIIPNYLIQKYHLDPKTTLFVGDSLPDYLTAKNASLPIALCLWGYGFFTKELLARCDYVFQTPEDLFKTL